MSIRRILTTAGVVIVALALGLVSLGLTVWSQPNQPGDLPAPATPAETAAVKAKADLATKLSVDADSIEVLSTDAHTWTDTSLGLPEPGMMYAQMETSGHIVTLSYDGKTYVYRVAGGTVALEPEDGAEASTEPSGAAAPMVPYEPSPTDRGSADDAVAVAVEALSTRLGVDAGAISVDATEEATWGDTSLGLPEPGMMYAQVETGGYVVSLSYDGEPYVYHIAGKTARLEENMDSAASAPQPNLEQAAAVEQAREDLAARVDAPVEDVAVESVEAHTWNDTSLGLPEPGMMYAQVMTGGYIVTLDYGGQ